MQLPPNVSKTSNSEKGSQFFKKIFQRGNIKTRIILCFLLLSISLVILGLINFSSLTTMEEKFDFVIQHDVAVTDTARELEKLVLDMETGQRGFIITGKESFLVPYTDGVKRFHVLMDEEIVMVSYNTNQVKKLEVIHELVNEWVAKAAEPEIALAKIYHQELRLNKGSSSPRVSMEDVSKLIQKRTGKKILDKIRLEFKEFLKEEKKLTEFRYAEATISSLKTKNTSIYIIVFGGIGALLIGAILSNSIIRPILKLTASALEIADGNLDNEVDVERNDEVSVLARHMESMRLNLKKNIKELSDYRYAIDQTSIVVISDNKGIITYVNDKFSLLTKYRADEVIGKPHTMMDSGHHSPEFFKDLWSQIEKGEVFNADMKNKAKDGSFYWTDTTIVPFMDKDGKPFQFVSIKKDITDGKLFNITLESLVETLRIAKENQSQFLSNMSHEIRTPMNGILGMTRLLQKTKLKKEQKKYTDAIFTSGNSLMVIINEILDFSKIEAGKLTIEQTPFSLYDKLIIWNETLGINARERNIDFKINLSEDIPKYIIGDPVRLTQIIYNLGGNAMKFSEEGKVTINIFVAETKGEEISIQVDVIDNGIGIAKDKLEAVFSSFSQASSSTTRKYGGTGLGLAITKQLVELQEGKVWVESELGKGSTFSFVIPYLQDLEKQNVKALIKPKKIKNRIKGISVLLVEDHVINQLLARTVLEGWKFKVDLAVNGIEAVQKVKDNKYDVILMDIHMPEMDGYQATIEIRNTLKDSTPIIALTASAQISENQKCFDIGMNDFISKPFDPELLLEKITIQVKK
jgi:PAS domain S-box-containing protein